MCLKRIEHRLSCDVRPLLATNLESRAGELFVDAFATPRHCLSTKCPADPDTLPPLPAREACPYHPCCRIASIADLRCPESCCPLQSETKDLFQSTVFAMVGAKAYKHRITECSHYCEYHVYIPDGTRAAGRNAGRNARRIATPRWDYMDDVRYPYPDLLQADVDAGLDENPMFTETRRRMLSAGRRLLKAKRAYIRARRDWDEVWQNNGNGLPHHTRDMIRQVYEFSMAAGRAAQVNFDEWKEMLKWLESHDSGNLIDIRLGRSVFSRIC